MGRDAGEGPVATAGRGSSQKRLQGGLLQRVPPHDIQIEQYLLGSALIHPDAAALVADMDPSMFYRPAHANIAAAVRALVTDGKPADPGVVAAYLREQGQLDSIQQDGFQGGSYLTHLQAENPIWSQAPAYVAYVRKFAQQRRMLHLASNIVDAVYSGLATDGLVAEMAAESEADLIGVESSWDLVNLAETLAGTDGDEHPCYLRRTDGVPLLYPGKVHAFNAESETGKSMLAIWACAERLLANEHVGYIDFEDSARGVVDRLLGFGVSPSAALDRFHYMRPDDPIDGAARLKVKEMLKVFPVTLCVIDGVAEALALSGWEENSGTDILAFYAALPRMIGREGTAVILIDHLVKDKEKQGNDARGSGAKRAGIDGASFKLEMVRSFTRGGQGMARVGLTKDRPGWIRPSAAGKTIAEMHLSSGADGSLRCELRPPSSVGDQGEFRPTVLMERVSRLLEDSTVGVSQRWVEQNVKSNTSHVRRALAALVQEGYAEIDSGPRRAVLHRSVRPFRESAAEPQGPAYDEEEMF